MTLANPGVNAVVLAGGGAYAAYEVGAMKAILSGTSAGTAYTPVDPQIYAGTSAGAYNAAVMVAQPVSDYASTIEYLENVWLNEISESSQTCGNRVYRFRLDPLPYLNPQCIATNPVRPFTDLVEDATFFAQDWLKRGINFFLMAGDLEQRALALFDLSTVISNQPFAQLINDTIPLERIRGSHKKLRVASTNWKTGQLKVFENIDMVEATGHQAITASTSLPGIFPPVYIAGDPYVDGGVVMNTPLRPAIQAGADTLHVIYLDPDVKNIPLRRLQNSLDVIDRMRVIMFALTINADIHTSRSINKGLRLLNRISKAESPPGEELSEKSNEAILSTGSIEEEISGIRHYKTLTIHRYHPRDEMGGTLGVLNFDRRLIERFINRGFEDAAGHNCFNSDCIVPLLDKF